MTHAGTAPAPPKSIADYQSLVAEAIGRGEESRREVEREERSRREASERKVVEYAAYLARRGMTVMSRGAIEARVENLNKIFHWVSGACASYWKNPLFGTKVVQCDAMHAHCHGFPSNLARSRCW